MRTELKRINHTILMKITPFYQKHENFNDDHDTNRQNNPLYNNVQSYQEQTTDIIPYAEAVLQKNIVVDHQNIEKIIKEVTETHDEIERRTREVSSKSYQLMNSARGFVKEIITGKKSLNLEKLFEIQQSNISTLINYTDSMLRVHKNQKEALDKYINKIIDRNKKQYFDMIVSEERIPATAQEYNGLITKLKRMDKKDPRYHDLKKIIRTYYDKYENLKNDKDLLVNATDFTEREEFYVEELVRTLRSIMHNVKKISQNSKFINRTIQQTKQAYFSIPSTMRVISKLDEGVGLMRAQIGGLHEYLLDSSRMLSSIANGGL